MVKVYTFHVGSGVAVMVRNPESAARDVVIRGVDGQYVRIEGEATPRLFEVMSEVKKQLERLEKEEKQNNSTEAKTHESS